MKNNSNMILTILISVTFIVLWDVFVASRYAPSKSVFGPTHTAVVAPPPAASAPAPSALPAVKKAITVLKTDREIVTVESRGARVKSWKLREKDHWVELVHSDQGQVYPLETFPALDFSVNQASPGSVTFLAEDPSTSLRISKMITLGGAGPFHKITLSLTNTEKRQGLSRLRPEQLEWRFDRAARKDHCEKLIPWGDFQAQSRECDNFAFYSPCRNTLEPRAAHPRFS